MSINGIDTRRESFLLAPALALLLQATPPPAPREAVQVRARSETAAAPSPGDSADDVAIWIHPSQPALGLVIGADKKGGLLVYDLDGTQRQHLAAGRTNNVDIRYRFPLAGKEVALVTTGMRDRNLLAAYAVDPDARTLRDVAARPIPLRFDVYGCCMYRSRATGETYFFGTSEDGTVQQWRLFDAGAGRVDAERVRSFDVGGTCEGCVADDENGWFFVSEEDVGIWRYSAEPDGGEARVRVDGTDGRHLDEDVEGLTIYYASGGAGYLIASSQGNDTFAVYERSAPHRHRLSFRVAGSSGGGVDAVSGTDGLDVINLGLGQDFPGGLLAVQDDSNPGGNQNFKYVDWRDVASAVEPPLVVDPEYDAYGAREIAVRR